MSEVPWTPRLQAAVEELGAVLEGAQPWRETAPTAISTGCWALHAGPLHHPHPPAAGE